MKIKVITKEEIFKYISVALAVLLLITTITTIAFGVKNHKKAQQIEELNSELVQGEAELSEKMSEYDSLKEEQSSEAQSYEDEISSQQKVLDELNKKIEDLKKQLSTKKESTTKKQESEVKPVMPEPIPSKGKTVYLTFDDGPSPYTSKILDILDEYGVKATFFVMNGRYNSKMKDIVDRGHAIGLHTYSHNYSKVYASDEAYFNDLQKISEVVKKETGAETKLIRFPGGSSNTISKKYSKGIMTRLTKSVLEEGYVYFDWNCSNGDADGADTVQKQLEFCSKFPKGAKNIVVLMHDTKKVTMEALPKIIEYYKSCEMEFGILTPTTEVSKHPVLN